MKIRALIADDHPGRDDVRSLLSEEDDVEVIGMAASGSEAVAAVERLSPDLVFLDPELPDLDGFAVIAAIGADRMPPTILVTSHGEFALRAFEFQALDYLLKPVDRRRFQQALGRARLLVQRERADRLADRVIALVKGARTEPPGSNRFPVHAGGRVVLIDLDRLEWVEAEGNYMRLHVGAESYLTRDTMINLMTRLTEDRFFRIHRSRIVRLECVRELRVASGGDYDVILKNGRCLGVSRLRKDALHARLTGA